MQIERNLFSRLSKELKRKEIVILLGPRQVGKTYLLHWLQEKIEKRKVPSSYFNLEDPDHLQAFNKSPQELYHDLIGSGRVIFIDEFHYLKNASQLFKALYDRHPSLKIFASGSSSIEIHKHLKESLAGRRRLIKTPPLSFEEIEKHIGKKASHYYFRFGGLPGVLKEKNDKERIGLLHDLLQAYILKDIKSLVKEENIRAFNTLLYLLAQNQGSLISVDNLAREIGLTARSVQRYLDIMEQTYILGVLPSYSRNLGNELKKSRKFYLYDIGIRNALIKDFQKIEKREDRGLLIETAVFLNLSIDLQPNEEVRFWRTRDGREVDFIFLRDRQPIPIEVKYSWKAPEIPTGLKSFLNRYPHTKKGYILSSRKAGKIRYKKTTIFFNHWADPLK